MLAPEAVLMLLVVLAALLAGVILLRGHVSVLIGPVAFYDMVRVSRRGRYFLLRMAYACLLALILFIVYAFTYANRPDLLTQRRDVYVAEFYFYGFMFAQLFAVSILTPAYVAGSLAEEKERKTLEFILATDLSSFEIVVGKLAARFANLVLFVLVGLPILSVLQFLGGVDPDVLLAGFAATIATMIGMGGVSILCSVLFKKPSRAVACAVLGFVAYLGLGIVGFIMQNARLGFTTYRLDFGIDHPWLAYVPTLHELVNYFNAGNLYLIFLRLAMAASTSQFYQALLDVLRDYVLFHVFLGLVCTGLAIRWLRVVALRQAYDMPQKTESRHGSRPEVSDRPILWKEMHVEVKRRWTDWLALALMLLLLLGGGGWAVVYGYMRGDLFSKEFTFGVNIAVAVAGAFLVLLLVLGVGIRAASCISGEREKDTLDGLLATPLDSDTILRDKVLAAMLSRRSILVMLGIVWLYGMIFGGIHIIDVIIMVFALYVVVRAYALIGAWFSMVSRSSSQATLYTVLPCVGTLFCCSLLSPAHLFVYIPFVSFQLRHPIAGGGEIFTIALVYGACAAFNLAVYGALAVFLWYFALKPRFRKMTHRVVLEPPDDPPEEDRDEPR